MAAAGAVSSQGQWKDSIARMSSQEPGSIRRSTHAFLADQPGPYVILGPSIVVLLYRADLGSLHERTSRIANYNIGKWRLKLVRRGTVSISSHCHCLS